MWVRTLGDPREVLVGSIDGLPCVWAGRASMGSNLRGSARHSKEGCLNGLIGELRVMVELWEGLFGVMVIA